MQVLRGCYIIDRGSWAINSKYDVNLDEYALCRRICQLFMSVGVLSRLGGV